MKGPIRLWSIMGCFLSVSNVCSQEKPDFMGVDVVVTQLLSLVFVMK